VGGFHSDSLLSKKFKEFLRSSFKFLILKEFSSALKFSKYIQVVFKEFKE